VNRRRRGRALFAIGFIVLLADGAAAIWLGQISRRPLLIIVGLGLIAAAAGVILAWRRWLEALAAVDAARAELKVEIGRLREAAEEARGRRSGY